MATFSEMMKAARGSVSDVHAGTFADSFEAFKDFDAFCAIVIYMLL